VIQMRKKKISNKSNALLNKLWADIFRRSREFSYYFHFRIGTVEIEFLGDPSISLLL
jgi:hypothetical protein